MLGSFRDDHTAHVLVGLYLAYPQASGGLDALPGTARPNLALGFIRDRAVAAPGAAVLDDATVQAEAKELAAAFEQLSRARGANVLPMAAPNRILSTYDAGALNRIAAAFEANEGRSPAESIARLDPGGSPDAQTLYSLWRETFYQAAALGPGER